MELLVTVQDPIAGRPVDLRISFSATNTVGELAAALARRLAVDTPTGLWRADGQQLTGERTILDTGMVDGDVVHFSRPHDVDVSSRQNAHEGLELCVVAGPRNGLRLPIIAGSHLVGRTAELRIDDPAVSRTHLRLQIDDAGSARVTDLDSANGSRLGGSELAPNQPAELALNQELALGPQTRIVIRRVVHPSGQLDGVNNVPFQRSPFFRVGPRTRDLGDVPPVPEPAARRRTSWATIVVPVIGGIGFAVLFDNPTYLAFAAMGPLIFLWTLLGDRRADRKQFETERSEFRSRLANLTESIRAAQTAELAERRAAAPDAADIVRRAVTRSETLWERPPESPDFLRLRLGRGEVGSLIKLAPVKGGDKQLAREAERAIGGYDTLVDAPIVVDLRETRGLAIVSPGRTDSLVRSLVAQAATLHSPSFLAIAAVLDTSATDEAGWMKWLPHVRTPSSPIDGDHVVLGAAGAAQFLPRVLRALSNAGDESLRTHLLLVIDAAAQPDRSLLARICDVGGDRLTLIWLTSTVNGIPSHLAARLDLNIGPPDALLPGATLRSTDPLHADTLVDIEGLDLQTATTVARALAPVRDAAASQAVGAIPPSAPLLDTIALREPCESAILARWNGASREALIWTAGVGTTGPLALDLVEHGPHGLIAGTSGAGKSELLSSMIAGLAANYPPTHLTFLFVDYKGGAAIQPFRNLPHNVGEVTDLTPALATRALLALRAELRRRESVLNDPAAPAKDLIELAARRPDDALPRLIIVIDEFATLVKELPDFVTGVVDVAQRGRSLGVHLLLATQRPRGSVNENILANTNLRIALRLLDQGESTDIIGTRDAAAIPPPLRGRALVQYGAGEPIAFQTAFGGAPFGAGQRPEVTVEDFDLADLSEPTSAVIRHGTDPGEPSVTELAELLAAIELAGRQFARPRRPWLPELPAVISVEEVLAEIKDERLAPEAVPIGRIDDPIAQLQPPLVIDFARSGGLIVLGLGGSGKTTTLATVALAALAQSGGLDRIFAIDAGNGALTNLLTDVADVVPISDAERVTRLLEEVNGEIDARLGMSDETAGGGRVILLIDQLVTLLERLLEFDRGVMAGYDVWTRTIIRILADGRSCSVCVAMTGTTEEQLRVYLNRVSAVVQLNPPRPSDDTTGPATLAGAGVMGDQFVQIATWSGALPTNGMQPRIGRLPGLVVFSDLPRTAQSGRQVALGIGDADLKPAHLNLDDHNLAVVGRAKQGHTNALALIARQLLDRGERCHLICLPGSSLAHRLPWETVATTTAGALEALSALESGERLTLFIDDAHSLVKDWAPERVRAAVSLGLEKPTRSRVIVACPIIEFRSSFTRSSIVSAVIEATAAVLLLAINTDERAFDEAHFDARSFRRRPGVVDRLGRGVLLREQGEIVQVARA